MSVVVEPFPDETIKSWLSRFQHISCEKVKYASSNLAWANDLPSLDPIVRRWSKKSGLDYDHLNRRLETGHTYSNLEKGILSDGGAVGVTPAPRMCNDCIIQDIKFSGVAYTHRSHNFSGVDCCHIHGRTLQHYCSACNTAHAKHPFWRYYDCEAKLKDKPFPSVDAPEVDIKYAKFIHELLHAEIEDVGRDALSNLIDKQSIYLGLRNSKSAKGWCVGAHKYASNTFKKGLNMDQGIIRYRNNAVSLPAAAKYTFSIFKDFNYLDRLKLSLKNPDELFPFPPKDENGYDYLVESEKREILALLEQSSYSSKIKFVDENFIIVSKVRFWDMAWLRATLKKYFGSA